MWKKFDLKEVSFTKTSKGFFKILDLAFLSKGMLKLPICFVRKLHFNCCLKIRHFIRL